MCGTVSAAESWKRLVCQALKSYRLKRMGVPSMRDFWVRFNYGEQAIV